MDDLHGIAKIGYLAACVIVPALWGGLSAWFFTRRDRKTKMEAELERRPPVDYVI
jgi:hypothetical protein